MSEKARQTKLNSARKSYAGFKYTKYHGSAMITVKYYLDGEEMVLSRFHGFQIDHDGLSNDELFEVDRRAARQAIDRYLADRESLYHSASSELKQTNLWLVRGLGRLPADNLWQEFQVYFLFARLRILLSENPQPVKCAAAVNQTVSDELETLCKEFKVEYVSNFRESNGFNNCHPCTSVLRGIKSRLHTWSNGAFGRLRPWLILSIFIIVRPIVLVLYSITRTEVDFRFWLHPFEDHLTRLYDSPSDLESRGYQIGYALYNYHAMVSLKLFISEGIKTIRHAFEPERPEPVEWYLNPGDFLEVLMEAPRLRESIQLVGSQARDRADSPEFTYLARQAESVSRRLVVQSLLIERAIEGFSEHVKDETWCIPRGLTKITPRLLAIIGNGADITTVGVSPHFISETRVGYHLSNPEIEGQARVSLPDMYIVFEPRSAETLRKQHPPSRIAVTRDKMEAETLENGDKTEIQERLPSTNSSAVSPPDDSQPRVLVIMTVPPDNREIVDALESITGDVPNVQLVFKPHPLVPWRDDLIDGLQDINVEVTAPEASLSDLIRACDICISMYSTAAIPALAQAIPVVWVPLGSPNHVRMDLITEVGIRADDPDDLARALERLVQDESFYVEQAQECAKFAEKKLVPSLDMPSFAELIEETGKGHK